MFNIDDEKDDEHQLLFLVEGTLSIQHYMSDKPVLKKIKNLVYALNEDEAEKKFEKYYTNKNSEYETYYDVKDIVVYTMIM